MCARYKHWSRALHEILLHPKWSSPLCHCRCGPLSAQLVYCACLCACVCVCTFMLIVFERRLMSIWLIFACVHVHLTRNYGHTHTRTTTNQQREYTHKDNKTPDCGVAAKMVATITHMCIQHTQTRAIVHAWLMTAFIFPRIYLLIRGY